MATRITRRRLLQNAALYGAGAFLASKTADARVLGANDRLNIGIVGVANRGGDDLDGVKSENIVALCDIDDNYLARTKMMYPNATTYNDFRKMLEQKDIDAVVVATPDHVHAPASSAAILSGRHIYCEKPLAHSVSEVRRVTELAHKHKRVSQMGTQIHAESNYRRVVEIIQSEAIGAVSEVHVWVERVWAGTDLPPDMPPVPPNLHWDLWLGPAQERPYNPAYLPGNWRGWWAFGNGTLGDMACHHMDLPWWALDLHAPTRVSAEGPPVSAELTPAWLIVHYEFPARGSKPPVKLTWYHGRRRPDYFAQGKLPTWGDGTLFVGEKGMLISDYGEHKLLPESDFAGYVPPKPTIPDSIGHHKEWIEACKTGGPTTCNFGYSGPLTEAVLLGAVAYRTGTTIEWDSKHLKATGCPEADAIIKPTFRDGWTV